MKVGDKVECIDNKGIDGMAPFPVQGQLYTITAIVNDPEHGLGLQLAELNMEPDDFLYARRFRDILDRSLK